MPASLATLPPLLDSLMMAHDHNFRFSTLCHAMWCIYCETGHPTFATPSGGGKAAPHRGARELTQGTRARYLALAARCVDTIGTPGGEMAQVAGRHWCRARVAKHSVHISVSAPHRDWAACSSSAVGCSRCVQWARDGVGFSRVLRRKPGGRGALPGGGPYHSTRGASWARTTWASSPPTSSRCSRQRPLLGDSWARICPHFSEHGVKGQSFSRSLAFGAVLPPSPGELGNFVLCDAPSAVLTPRRVVVILVVPYRP